MFLWRTVFMHVGLNVSIETQRSSVLMQYVGKFDVRRVPWIDSWILWKGHGTGNEIPTLTSFCPLRRAEPTPPAWIPLVLTYFFVSLHLELKEPVGQIVCTDKGILAVEQNKVLVPPTWSKTFAWGYADLSCRLANYESDKVSNSYYSCFFKACSCNLQAAAALCHWAPL